MNILIDKNIFNLLQTYIDKQSNNDHKSNRSLFHRLKKWNHQAIPQRQLFFNNTNKSIKNYGIMCVTDIPFIIPRRIEDVQKQCGTNFERSKLMILRMDEYLLSTQEKTKIKQRRQQNTSVVGLRALADAANTIQKIAFREVLSLDETLPIVCKKFTESEEVSSMDKLLRQKEKIEPITNFHQSKDFYEFEQSLLKHRMNILYKPTNKPSDMIYLKFCLLFEIQRDEHESCLRILLHDIIFKYHLSDFRLRCHIHLRKPIEHELVIEEIIHDSHLKANYSAEFNLWSADWIVQQEVEFYVVMRIESLSINKFISSKFWDMAHLHVKNVPHGASRIFLRELTPVYRPHKILSRNTEVGQVEIEVGYWSDRQQLSIHIGKITHAQTGRLLGTPETYIDIIFQSPFDIYDIKRTKTIDRSLDAKFDDEFLFQIPDKISISDITIDLIFLEKSPLHYHPIVLGVLTLSKHTDWYPVRKFWSDVEENPNVKLKDRFLFEGNIYD